MNICLINSYVNKPNSLEVPITYHFYGMYAPENLNVGYVASTLRLSGHAVSVLECEIESLSNDDVITRIKEYGCKLAIIYIDYDNSIAGLVLAKKIMLRCKEVKVALFGEYPSNMYKKLLRMKIAHFLVVGEPEYTFLLLAQKLETGEPIKIAGLFTQDSGMENEPVLVKSKLIEDIDSLPLPERSYVQQTGCAKILTARGCYNTCTYCTRSLYYRCSKGSVFRRRSPEHVVEEIEFLIKSKNVKWIIIDDHTFHISGRDGRQWFDSFYRLIVNKGINANYFCRFRANEVVDAVDQLEHFIEIGLKNVEIGIESYSSEFLQFYQKNVTVEQNIQAICICNEKKLNLYTNMIMFEAHTRLQDIRDAIKWLDYIEKTAPFQSVQRPLSLENTMYALEGTAYYDYITKAGLLKPNGYGYRFMYEESELCHRLLQCWNPPIQKIYAKRFICYLASLSGDKALIDESHAIYKELMTIDRRAVEAICDAVQAGISDTVVAELHFKFAPMLEYMEQRTTILQDRLMHIDAWGNFAMHIKQEKNMRRNDNV